MSEISQLLEELTESYYQGKRIFYLIRFMLSGVVIIALGVSQLVWGWIGETVVMRYLYSTVLIVLGAGVLYFCWCAVRRTSIFPSDIKNAKNLKERAFERLARLLPGNYGPFEADDALLDEIRFLLENQYVSLTIPVADFPIRGENLSEIVIVDPQLKDHLVQKQAISAT